MSHWNGDSILAFCSFIDIRVLLTAAEIDLFTVLTDHPLSIDDIVSLKHTQKRPTQMLLDALVAMDLLEKNKDKYVCPQVIARCLSSHSRDSVLPMVRHYGNVWRNVSKLTTAVLGPDATIDDGMSEDDRTRAFIGGMHVRARDNAARIVAELDAGTATHVIDIGGASGSYTIAFLRAFPQIHVTLFDLPFVTELARERLTEAGLLDRVTLVPGDFYTDELPKGHDIALLSAIIHQNSPEQNLELYRKAFGALLPGGRLVIRDYVMNPDHNMPRSGALFAINMLVGTEGGGTYSFDETRTLLEKVGFNRIVLRNSNSEMDCIIDASRPKLA